MPQNVAFLYVNMETWITSMNLCLTFCRSFPDHIPSWGWWSPLGCVHWWWCQTWRLHHRARCCTLLRHFSRCPSRGLWFFRQQIPLQKTRGLLCERNLLTNRHQTALIWNRHRTSDGEELFTSSVFHVFEWACRQAVDKLPSEVSPVAVAWHYSILTCLDIKAAQLHVIGWLNL